MLNGFKNSKMHSTLQKVLRVLQFLSSFSSMVVFSIRVNRILRLTNALTTAQGAVEGILVAAVFYTICVTIITFLIKSTANHTHGSNLLRWFLVFMDVLFIGAFIAVAVLTRPNNGGSAGPCRSQLASNIGGSRGTGACKLPLGSFVTAIFSTIFHLLTAIFQSIRKQHRETHDTTLVKNNNNNYAMDGRDSATLHGRDSTAVPVGGHANGTHAPHVHNNNAHGAGHTNATPYNNGVGHNNV